jgi:hypothetical protein
VALLDEQPRELGGEEGVALRPCVEGGHDVLVDRTARRLRQQLAGLLQGQPAQGQPAGPGGPAQLRQGADDGLVAADLEVTHGRDDQDRCGAEPRADAGEQVEARGVRPLQVVDQQDQTRAARQQPDGLGDAVRDRRGDRDGGGTERSRARVALEHGGGGSGHLAPRSRGAEQLQPGPVRGRHARLESRRGEHRGSARRSPGAQLLGEPGLADARLTLQHHVPAAGTGEDLVEDVVEDPELGSSTDQRPPGGRLGGHPLPRDRCDRRSCRHQIGVVVEDAGLQCAQRRRRVEAQLVGEQPATLLEDGERLGLSPVAVEGESEQAPATLAQRGSAHRVDQRGDDPARGTAPQLRVEQVLLRRAPLLAPSRSDGPPGVRTQILQDLAPPQGQRRAEQADGPGRLVGVQGGGPLRRQLPEARRVQRTGLQHQAVARHLTSQQLVAGRAEGAAQSGDVGLQRRRRGVRQVLAPHRAEQHVDAHDAPLAQQQRR